jgi:hypothetical protein
MDIIAETVQVGFVKCREAGPLKAFREAVLREGCEAYNEAETRLRELPQLGTFDVRRVPNSDYFLLTVSDHTVCLTARVHGRRSELA